MPLSSENIETLLRASFEDASINLEDLVGDQDHFSLRIVSDAFEGKNRVGRHQMVYKALGPHMGTTLHALSITALTPAEAASAFTC